MKKKTQAPAAIRSDAPVEGMDLLSLVGRSRPRRGDAPAVVKLAGFSATGRALVRLPDCDDLVEARRSVSLSSARIGADVLVLYEDEDPRLPIIVGVLVDPDSESSAEARPDDAPAELRVGAERLVLEAGSEIVIRCGKASVTLRRDGRISLRGEELESRAAGHNKIKGAAVHLN